MSSTLKVTVFGHQEIYAYNYKLLFNLQFLARKITKDLNLAGYLTSELFVSPTLCYLKRSVGLTNSSYRSGCFTALWFNPQSSETPRLT